MDNRLMTTLLSLCLCGCGGGGEDPQQPVPITPCQQQVSVQFGDSTWEGQPTYFIREKLDNRFGQGATLHYDRAVPGSNLTQLLAGTDIRGKTLQAQIQEIQPRVVVLGHAINSMGHVTPEQFKAELEQADDIVRANGARLVLATPFPQTEHPPYGSAERREAIGAYADVIRVVAVARGRALIDINAWVNARPYLLDHIYDGIHPDAELKNLVFGGIVAQAIGDALKQGSCLR